MAQYKISFLFQQFGSGWSEQWYRIANNLDAAVALTPAFLNNFLAIRGVGVTLVAVRANDVAVKRVSKLKIYNTDVPAGPGHNVLGDAEPPGVAVLGYVTAANNTRRSLLLRGLSDTLVNRTPDGRANLGGTFDTAFTKYVQAVVSAQLQIRTINAADIGNPDRAITQLAPAADGQMTTILYDNTTPPIPLRSLVVFHGLDRNRFQGFGGPLPVVAVAAGGITVPVRWQNAGNVAPGLAATVRIASYGFNQVQTIVAEDVRTKKVGVPSIHTRGRRKGARFRAA